MDADRNGTTSESEREAGSFANWLVITVIVAIVATALFAMTPPQSEAAYALLALPILPFVVANRHLLRQLRLEKDERAKRGARYANPLARWAFHEHPGLFWFLVAIFLIAAPFAFAPDVAGARVQAVRIAGLVMMIVMVTFFLVTRRRRG